MKRHTWILSLIVASLVFPASALFAQPSAQEAEALMKAINDRMRDLEQELAKAAREPESLNSIVSLLKDLVAKGQVDQLPQSLKDFLFNNPDLLAKLKNPSGTPEEQRKVEDEIRKLLAEKDNGLEELLKQNPEMLKRLLEQQDLVENALRKHAEAENDIQRLFRKTEQGMHTAEDDIKKLIEMAQQMQQQMNQGQQPQEQEGDKPKPGEENKRPENQNDNTNRPNQAPNEYSPPPAGPHMARPNEPDPAAWDLALPETELSGAAGTSASPKPEGYETEAERYYSMLAKIQAQERQTHGARTPAQTPPATGSGTTPNSGSGTQPNSGTGGNNR